MTGIFYDTEEFALNREDMINELRQRDCRVIFKKTNGEERDMICTLREEVVPAGDARDIDRKPNPDVLAVWDVQKEGWRSFRVENVISFS